MQPNFYLSAIICCVIAISSYADNDSIFKIIAGAETHAMIEACDCPNDPGGGLLKRSSIIKSFENRNRLLLLDAGGFAGGGIYDSYSEGRAGDSVRTILTLKGMGKIGYDAVAIGDEELQYGGEWIVDNAKAAGVTLVTANCFNSKGKTLATPYILLKKAGVTFGITALTSPEKLLATDTTVNIKDPVKSLRQIWKELVDKSDYQIVLSHLGQQESEAIADSFPDCDFIINGHRKTDKNPVLLSSKKIPIMQFGFQGKSLSFVQMHLSDMKTEMVESKWIYVDPQTPDDSTLIPLLSSAKPIQSKPVYDLYMMSQCPYGIQALSGFLEFTKAFKNIDWNIQFIGTVDDDTSFSSLHGEEEVKDEMIWLAVKECFPDKWIDFLKLRSKEFIPTGSILQKMKIDTVRIQKWISQKGRKELSSHYQRSARLNIKASPTLLINNVVVDMQITKDRLAQHQCKKISGESSYCKALPECFEDIDCKKKGKIGRCGETGKCIFQDAVPFVFTVLVADSSYQKPEQAVISTTEELFSGASVQVVKLGSIKGKEIVKKFNPDALPFYIFSKEVKQAYNFTSVESGLIEKNGSLIFKDGLVPSNYFLKRPYTKGSTVLFIDPFFPQLPYIIKSVCNDSNLRKSIEILPIVFNDPNSANRGTEEWFRTEEAARWLSLHQLNEEKYSRYLTEYSKAPGSSYWPELCRKSGIDIDSLSMYTLSDKTKLVQHWNLLKSISIQEPLVILVDNKEMITIRSEKEFELFLQQKIKKTEL